MASPRSALIALLATHTRQLNEIIFPITLLLVFRLLFRRMVPAMIALSLCGMLLYVPRAGGGLGFLFGFCLILVIGWTLLLRFGLLAFATFFCTSGVIEVTPLTLSPASWYAGSMFFALAVIAAPALWGFWTSRGKRALFGDDLLEQAERQRT